METICDCFLCTGDTHTVLVKHSSRALSMSPDRRRSGPYVDRNEYIQRWRAPWIYCSIRWVIWFSLCPSVPLSLCPSVSHPLTHPLSIFLSLPPLSLNLSLPLSPLQSLSSSLSFFLSTPILSLYFFLFLLSLSLNFSLSLLEQLPVTALVFMTSPTITEWWPVYRQLQLDTTPDSAATRFASSRSDTELLDVFDDGWPGLVNESVDRTRKSIRSRLTLSKPPWKWKNIVRIERSRRGQRLLGWQSIWMSAVSRSVSCICEDRIYRWPLHGHLAQSNGDQIEVDGFFICDRIA